MKKKEIFYILLGITMGNALSLFLTLYLWGSAWWQVAIAIFAGTFVGIMITDFKLFKQFALESYGESIIAVEKIWSNDFWQVDVKSHKRLSYFIHNILLTILILGLLAIDMYLINIYATQNNNINVIETIPLLIPWVYLLLALINPPQLRSSLHKAFGEFLFYPSSGEKRINGEEEALEDAYEALPFSAYLKKLWYAKWLDFTRMWRSVLRAVLFIVFGLILALVAWLPLILFISLKNILKYNQFLLVFLGVAIGTITGVLTMNIVFGLIAGIIPVFVAILFNVIASKFDYEDADKVFTPIMRLV